LKEETGIKSGEESLVSQIKQFFEDKLLICCDGNTFLKLAQVCGNFSALWLHRKFVKSKIKEARN